jgi:iron complex outermembrane recepter protein
MSLKISNATPLVKAMALAFGGLALLPQAAAQQSNQTEAKEQRIEITGSRLKRAESEGALPVTVIDRAAIEASGQSSVAELMRTITFASFGNTRPQSGSSAQALADIDLRGLGSNRTLVLIDGRRISKAPFQGQAQDLNSIPLAAIERVEILSDGASAVYGSDAIGGVVNFITRKNFNGVQITYGEGDPEVKGGKTKEAQFLIGTTGNKGRLLAGMSLNSRGSIFTRDQIGGGAPGVSTFGNNYRRVTAAGVPTGAHTPVPGFACNSNDFYFTAPGQAGNVCSFNFNASAANEASAKNKSVFLRGEYSINDDFQVYSAGRISNVETFGRYAATPVQVFLDPSSAPYQAITAATPGLAAASPTGLSLRHRMAAAGPRDTSTNATVSTGNLGVKGRLINSVDIDVGFLSEKYKYFETGRNFIVRPLLEAAILSGDYDIFNPFGTSPDVLNGVKATIARESTWSFKEGYGTASMDLFKIGNRTVTGLIGAEGRKEFYVDQFDPQSEAGIIEGSAGNTAAGSRTVKSGFFELVAPVLQQVELSLAGRYDRYNDVGGKFSPKLSARFQPTKSLTVRGSLGGGFRAPTLDVLTQKPSFSADSITDFRSCRSLGRTAVQCGDTNGDGIVDGAQPQLQVDATVIANPALKPETSKQASFGLVFDATNWLTVKADFYKIRINNRISNVSSQTVINRTNNTAGPAVPAGLSVTRDPVTGGIINVTRGAANDGTLDTSGVDLQAETDFRMGDLGRLRNRFITSYVSSYKIDGGANLLKTQALPNYRIQLQNTWSVRSFDFSLAANHIAAQRNDLFQEVPTASYTTYDLGVKYTFPTKTSIQIGAINFTDKLPALNAYDGRPWNFGLYDALGRQVYFRLQQTF